MNQNHTITAEIQESAAVGCRSVASVQDLRQLKRVFPASVIKHGDMSAFMHQNCDATTCVLTDTTIKELPSYVPASNVTQLYIQASMWTQCPYHNENFGNGRKFMGRLDDMEALVIFIFRNPLYFQTALLNRRSIGTCWY